jgi:hypothetical protein
MASLEIKEYFTEQKEILINYGIITVQDLDINYIIYILQSYIGK